MAKFRSGNRYLKFFRYCPLFFFILACFFPWWLHAGAWLGSARYTKPAESSDRHRQIAALPDDEFLDLISRKAFAYFWNEAGAKTGLVKDRSISDFLSSIAATGFGLAALCVADSRDWITHDQAYQRVNKTLTSLRDTASHVNGFFYHFIDLDTGERVWDSEVSSVDTAWLLAGVLTVQEYFKEREIKTLCRQIFERVDWKWMMDEKTKALYMGWTPENEFEKFISWDMFGEEMLMYILGMGAPANALPPASWHSFRRPARKYKKHTYIFCESESLFTYLYSHAFIDFRDRHDKYADYWRNSKDAVKANIAFAREYASEYPAYKQGFWGISASDGPDGYRNYGATIFTHDGTIAPYAMCASVPLLPDKAISALKKLISEYGDRVWDEKYGFVSGFNLNKDWFSAEHIGIDLGISLLMIENYRSEFVWKHFMKNEYVAKGMQKAGFEPGTVKLRILAQVADIIPVQKKYFAERAQGQGLFKGENTQRFELPDDIEYGELTGSDDLDAEFSFVWDDEYLYFTADIRDDVVFAKRDAEELYKDDSVELFFSRTDTLVWGDRQNFQIGFAPDSAGGGPVAYAFFQKKKPGDTIELNSEFTDGGYIIRAKIGWEFLNMEPEKNRSMGMSVSVHDIDEQGNTGKKINWFFKNSMTGIKLGRLILR
jgi:hypothetical protein